MSRYEWASSGVGVSTKEFHFSFSLSFRLLSFAKGDSNGDSLPGGSRRRKATALSVGLGEEGKRRPFYQWLSSKQRPATSLSIGGSLKRITTATVAAEANIKVKLWDLCACLRFFMFQYFKYACLYINHLIFFLCL